MSSPWPSAAPSSAPARTARHWGPLAGWLVLLAALVVALVALQDTTWASGDLVGVDLAADGDRLLDAEGTVYPATVGLLYVGLVVGTTLGVAAVPATTAGRWTLTVVLALCALAITGWEALPGHSSSGTGEVLLSGLALFGLPLAVVLPLVWRGARRAGAVTALGGAIVAAAAQSVTVVALGSAPADVGPGAWTVLIAVLLGLGGAVVVERTTPRRAR